MTVQGEFYKKNFYGIRILSQKNIIFEQQKHFYDLKFFKSHAFLFNFTQA